MQAWFTAAAPISNSQVLSNDKKLIDINYQLRKNIYCAKEDYAEFYGRQQ
jgi:predicted nucleic-acid-binding Zn-ribbon protein